MTQYSSAHNWLVEKHDLLHYVYRIALLFFSITVFNGVESPCSNPHDTQDRSPSFLITFAY